MLIRQKVKLSKFYFLRGLQTSKTYSLSNSNRPVHREPTSQTWFPVGLIRNKHLQKVKKENSKNLSLQIQKLPMSILLLK